MPVTDLKIVDNVFVKMHCFVKAGDTHEGHAHTFDHITRSEERRVGKECRL